MNQATRNILAIVIVLTVIAGAVFLLTHSPKMVATNTGTLHVIAAENFWGSIAAQIGGKDVTVTSIVSDPNADPHDYETTTDDARTFAGANYVILNGAGYDSWGDKLLAGNEVASRTVLHVADLVGKKEGDNPHLWYDPQYVNAAAEQMEKDMIALDPTHTADYQHNYETLKASLATYQDQIAAIKQQYGGTKVAATEDIFQYLADASGLDLISPSAFTEAVAEGTDPSVTSIAIFQDQLKGKEPKVLVYNEQTVTPLTENMKAIAKSEGIPTIGITETLSPANATFQSWMGGEISNLQRALAASATTTISAQ